MARKNSLERPEPREKPREEPGYEGWPVLFCLCRGEILTEHCQDFQMFINDQHGQIIVIRVNRSGFHSRRQNSYIYISFKSFSRRSYPERLTNWCIHLSYMFPVSTGYHVPGLPDMMTPCCPQSTWPCCCSSFNCSALLLFNHAGHL